MTRRALVDLVRPAVCSVYGVLDLAAPTVRGRVLRALGLATPGIVVSLHDGIEIRLQLVVARGLPVAEVARQVDSAVRYAIRHATDREVASLMITVAGLRQQPPVPAVSPVLAQPALPAIPTVERGPLSDRAVGRPRDRRGARIAKTG